jgi:Protein of unknown function (DUF2752)
MHAESQPVPPKIKAAMPFSLTFFTVVVLGLMALGTGTVIFFFNPSSYALFPPCLFHALTGLYCPGCGGTRAVYQLLHGHVLLALKDNALFVLALVALAVWGARFVMQKLRSQPATLKVSAKMFWAVLAVAFVFTVLRNLPAFSWLSP